MAINFELNDKVIFVGRPGVGHWRKGVISGDNHSYCYNDNYVGVPGWFVTEIDPETDKIIDGRQSYFIPEDSKYIVHWHDDYAWCVGKGCKEFPHIKYPDEDIINKKINMNPYDSVIIHLGTTCEFKLDWFQEYVSTGEEIVIKTISGYIVGKGESEWWPYTEEKWEECMEWNNSKRSLDEEIEKSSMKDITDSSEDMTLEWKDYEDYIYVDNPDEKLDKLQKSVNKILEELKTLKLSIPTYPITYPITNPTITDPYPWMHPIYCKAKYTTETINNTEKIKNDIKF